MGLFDNFLGGSKTKVKQYSNWNTEQQNAFNALAPQITAGLGKTAPTSPDTFVPTTSAEQTYLDWAKSEAVKNMATGVVPYEVGPEYADKYFEQSIRPIMERDWRDTVLPGIQEQYAGSTFNSTGRDAAVTKATERYGEDLSAKKAELIYNEELAKRKAIESAQGRIAPGIQIAQGAGQYSRAIESEKVMSKLQKFLMGEEVDGQSNQAYNPMVTLAFNLLGLQPFSYGSQTTGAGLGYQFLSNWAQTSGNFLGGLSLGGSGNAGTSGASGSGIGNNGPRSAGNFYEGTSGNDRYAGWNGYFGNAAGATNDAAEGSRSQAILAMIKSMYM